MKCMISYFALALIMTTTVLSLNLRSQWVPDTLGMDEKLDSSNKKYFAKMQHDGNFVVYSSKSSNGKGNDNAIWASNTNGRGQAPYRTVMQNDGNLVLYDKSNAALWASGSNGKGTGPYKLVMQDDGNLVVYDSKNQPIWATMTNGKK